MDNFDNNKLENENEIESTENKAEESAQTDRTELSEAIAAFENDLNANNEPVITDEETENDELIKSLKKSDEVAPADFSAKPKRSVILPSLKVAFTIILLCIIAVSTYFVFFNTNIKGTWTTTDEESPAVLTFKDGGVVEMTIGSTTIKGDYSFLDDEEEQNRVNISIVYSSTSFLYGDFNYTVTGNLFTGRTLTISDTSGNQLTLKSGAIDSPVSPDIDREYTKKLVGVWKNDTITYTFTDDGYMYLDYNYITFECSYSDDGEKIKAKYYVPEENEIEIEFKFLDDNTVEIDGLEFTRS